MDRNEYVTAEVVELGSAATVILGDKTNEPEFDSAGVEPMDRQYK